MNRRLPLYLGSAASLVWAASMLLFYMSGRIPTYLVGRGPFQTQALIAGIGIVVVALFVALTAGEKEADCGHDHGDGDDADADDEHDHDHECDSDSGCGHDHDHGHDHEQVPHHHHEQETPFGLVMMLLILVVPVATATVLTPDQRTANWYANNGAASNDTSKARKPTEDQDLAARVKKATATQPAATEKDEPADAAAAYASFTLDDLKAQVDQNDKGDLMITVPELFYTGGDKVIQDVLAGQGVETIGQVMAEIVNDNGKRLRVFRVFMECCAADSRPLAIPVEFANGLPKYKEMGWYKITGKMSYREERGLTIPLLEAETFEPTEEPENAIMY